jgi:hypothetical protein
MDWAGVLAANTAERPSFKQRLFLAARTSLKGMFLFFIPVGLFLLAAPWVLALSEPLASVAMYGSCLVFSGVACLGLNRRSLGLTWSATAATMIGPYLVVGGLPFGAGLLHLGFSPNPIGFIHTWFNLYALPMYGAIGPVVVAGIILLFGRLGGWREARSVAKTG